MKIASCHVKTLQITSLDFFEMMDKWIDDTYIMLYTKLIYNLSPNLLPTSVHLLMMLIIEIKLNQLKKVA